MKLISATDLINTPDKVLVASSKEPDPYGVYLMKNGDKILFNRSYSPMLKWSKKTKLITVLRDQWIDYESIVMFYNDSLSIKKTKILRNQIINLWLDNYPVVPEDMPEILSGLKEFKKLYK